LAEQTDESCMRMKPCETNTAGVGVGGVGVGGVGVGRAGAPPGLDLNRMSSTTKVGFVHTDVTLPKTAELASG